MTFLFSAIRWKRATSYADNLFIDGAAEVGVDLLRVDLRDIVKFGVWKIMNRDYECMVCGIEWTCVLSRKDSGAKYIKLVRLDKEHDFS